MIFIDVWKHMHTVHRVFCFMSKAQSWDSWWTGWMSGQRQTEAPPVWVCVSASDYLTSSGEINDALCLSSFPLCSRASNYSKLIGQIPVAGIISSPVCIHAIGWHYWAHPVLTERYGDAFNSWLKTLQFTSSCRLFKGDSLKTWQGLTSCVTHELFIYQIFASVPKLDRQETSCLIVT